MARLPDVLGSLDPAAQKVYERIAAKRGKIRGPYVPLMHHPALAERVADLGEYLRFDSTLPGDLRELVRTRGDLSKLPARYVRAARVVQHVLARESVPEALQSQVEQEVGITG